MAMPIVGQADLCTTMHPQDRIATLCSCGSRASSVVTFLSNSAAEGRRDHATTKMGLNHGAFCLSGYEGLTWRNKVVAMAKVVLTMYPESLCAGHYESRTGLAWLGG
jgi:hypothetical protein